MPTPSKQTTRSKRGSMPPVAKLHDPLCGLAWTVDAIAAQSMKGNKWMVHPDVDPADGRGNSVLLLASPLVVASVTAQSFATFQGKRLTMVEHRFPGTKQGKSQWAKKTAAQRVA